MNKTIRFKSNYLNLLIELNVSNENIQLLSLVLV